LLDKYENPNLEAINNLDSDFGQIKTTNSNRYSSQVRQNKILNPYAF